MVTNVEVLKKFTKDYMYKIYLLGITTPQMIPTLEMDSAMFKAYFVSHDTKYVLNFEAMLLNGYPDLNITLEEVDEFEPVEENRVCKMVKDIKKPVYFEETTFERVSDKYPDAPISDFTPVLDCQILCITLSDEMNNTGIFGVDEEFVDATIDEFNKILLS